jgi:hypothetical protein
MVERTEVVREAESRARQLIDDAEAEARRMRYEVEDYCDRKLGSFEVVLQRTLKSVATGRAKLQGVGRPGLAEGRGPRELSDGQEGAVFDQDVS